MTVPLTTQAGRPAQSPPHGANQKAGSGVIRTGFFSPVASSIRLSTLSHEETTVNAGQTLTIKTGRDANLSGTIAKGEQIKADIGRDPVVNSEQDHDCYKQNRSAASLKACGSLRAIAATAFASAMQEATNSMRQNRPDCSLSQ